MVRSVHMGDPREVTELVRGTTKSLAISSQYGSELPSLVPTGLSYVDGPLHQRIVPTHETSHWSSNQ